MPFKKMNWKLFCKKKKKVPIVKLFSSEKEEIFIFDIKLIVNLVGIFFIKALCANAKLKVVFYDNKFCD